MTDLLSRPPVADPAPAAPPASRRGTAALLGAGAAATVACCGLLLCVALASAGWFAADSGTYGDASRVGVLAWLVVDGAGLTGAGVSVGAVPLGFLLLAAYALYRAGRWTAHASAARSAAEVATAVGAMTAAYAGIGMLATRLTSVGSVHAPTGRAAVALMVLSGVAGGAGVVRGSDLAVGSARLAGLTSRIPEEVRAAGTGAAAGLATMLGLSALALAVSLGYHASTALTLAQGLHSGVVGGLLLLLLTVGLVPNAVLCAGAYLAGPGFAVGAGTTVSPGGVRLGELPDFPLLAALPSGADARWLPGLILVPVVAGGVAGIAAVRRYPVFGVDWAALRGALAGLAGGVVFGLLTVAARGAVGPGRLRDVGPDVLPTAAVCAVAFLLGGAIAAVSAWWLRGALRGALPRVRRRTADR